MKILMSVKRRKKGKVFIDFSSLSSKNESYRQSNRSAVKKLLSRVFVASHAVIAFFIREQYAHYARFAIVGFGIGIGISLSVVHRPDITYAIPFAPTIQQHVTAESISFGSKSLTYPVRSGSLWEATHGRSAAFIHLRDSAGLEGGGASYLTLKSSVFGHTSRFKSITIGESITIGASNNGVYSYTVTQKRYVSSDELLPAIESVGDGVLLSIPLDLFRSELLLIIAQ